MPLQLLVPDRQERHPIRQPDLRQPASGLGNGLRLDIKPPDMAAAADQTCQQQGVVPVAAGGINGGVAGAEETVQEQVGKWYRPAQCWYGRGEDSIMAAKVAESGGFSHREFICNRRPKSVLTTA